MTTQLISINEFRRDISSLWKKAQAENIKYTVLSHWKAVFEVTPVINNVIDDDWTEYTTKNHKAYLKAKKELEKWKTISLETLKSKYL